MTAPSQHNWKMDNDAWAQHLLDVDPVEIAWIAGFFDGEGCVSIRHKKRPANSAPWFQLAINVVNTYRAALERCQAVFFGTVHARKLVAGRRQCFTWILSDKAAERFLEAIHPYVRVKRTQIEAALEFRSLGQKRPHEKVSLERYTRMSELSGVVRQANGRNYRKDTPVLVPFEV